MIGVVIRWAWIEEAIEKCEDQKAHKHYGPNGQSPNCHVSQETHVGNQCCSCQCDEHQEAEDLENCHGN